MKIRRTLAVAALLTTALFTARPGAPFTLIEKNSFEATLTLSQAGFCDGSVRTPLQPGTYDVHGSRQADGAIIAVLFQGGVRKGETRAFAAPGSNQILIGLLLPAVQRVREAAAPPAAAGH
jgi:hypothetical protein